jgi:hypothetical protein
MVGEATLLMVLGAVRQSVGKERHALSKVSAFMHAFASSAVAAMIRKVD